MKTEPADCFVVSFHDLAPHCQEVCQDVLNQLAAIGIHRATLLVTPKWHDGESIDRRPDFLDWLRERESQGHEVCLHGYTHRAESVRGGIVAQAIGRIYTASEGEFYQISYDEARCRVGSGLRLLRGIGLNVQGFVAPAWLLSGEGRKALVDEGLLYTNDLNRFLYLQTGQRIFAPSLVFSSRSGWRRWVSIRWVPLWGWLNRRVPVIRLAIHPLDWEYPVIRETIVGLAKRLQKNRAPLTYRELAQRVG